MHAHIHIYPPIHGHEIIHTYIYIHTCARARAHTHTYIYIYREREREDNSIILFYLISTLDFYITV